MRAVLARRFTRAAALGARGAPAGRQGENLVQVGAALDGGGEGLDARRFLVEEPGLAQDDQRSANSDHQKAQSQKTHEDCQHLMEDAERPRRGFPQEQIVFPVAACAGMRGFRRPIRPIAHVAARRLQLSEWRYALMLAHARVLLSNIRILLQP